MRAFLATALLLLSTTVFADEITTAFLDETDTALAEETANAIITVRDSNRGVLRAGESYYIRPTTGGNLTLLTRSLTSICPRYVGQSRITTLPGIPVRFYPANPKQSIIRLNTDLNVVFDRDLICGQSSVWKVGLDTNDNWRWYVGTGGTVGNPGRETVSNWFKIQRQGSSLTTYKLEFCPSVCESCLVPCGDLGIYSAGGSILTRRFVGLSPDRNLTVVFKKVSELYPE